MSEGIIIKFRRGTQVNIDDYTPDIGECIWSTDKHKLFIGDGYTLGGREWLVGDSRTDLETYKLYGVNRLGQKGFHNSNKGIEICSNKINLGGSSVLSTSFGVIEVIQMPTATDSSIYFSIPYNPLWDITRDINIKMTYSMSGGSVGQLARLDGSYWVVKNGTTIDHDTPTSTYTNYIKWETNENNAIIDQTVLSAIKILNSDVDSDTTSIIFKLERNGDDAGDTFTGTLEIINLFFYQITNANDYGYYLGGKSSGGEYTISSIDRLTFPFNNGLSINVGNLAKESQGTSAINSSLNAYCNGGCDYDRVVMYSTISKLLFPFNSGTATSTDVLDEEKGFTAGCNCSLFGFIMGGISINTSVFLNSIVKNWFQFSSDSHITDVGNLSRNKHSAIGINSSLYGYVLGGYSTDTLKEIDKTQFSFNNGLSSNVIELSSSTRLLNMVNEESETVGTYSAGGFNSSLYGYISGGDLVKSISRLTFSSDSSGTILRGNIHTSTRSGVAGCNSTSYGFSMGGEEYGVYVTSSIDRINFAYDSVDAISVGNLSSTDYLLGSGIDGADFSTIFV